MLYDSPEFFGSIVRSSQSAIGDTMTLGLASATPFVETIRISRGTVDAPTIVLINDVAQARTWQGWDGTAYRDIASMEVSVNAAPGANDMPGEILFSATPNGSATLSPTLGITGTGIGVFGNVNCSSGLGSFQTLYVTGSNNFYGSIQAHAGIYVYTDALVGGDITFFYDTPDEQTLTPGGAALLGLTYAADKIGYTTAANAAATTTLSSFMRTLLDDTSQSAARTTLGLVIGTNVQAWGQQLDNISLITINPTGGGLGKILYWSATNSVTASDFSTTALNVVEQNSQAAMRSALGLIIGTDVQAWDTDLNGLAALGWASADLVPYTTAAHTFSTFTVTAAARTVLDDTTVAAMVNTLGGATSTGSGGLARATSPTFVTPTLGVATATSINLSSQAIDALNWNTFTPTVTNISNIAALGTPVGVWCRLGDFVHVIVTVNIDATTSGIFTSMGCTLPVATDLTNGFHLCGFMNQGNSGSGSGYCYADTVNDRAICNFFPTTSAAQDCRVMFSYKA